MARFFIKHMRVVTEPMRVFTKLKIAIDLQEMNYEHNYWHAPVSSCTLSTDALVLAIPVIPDMIIPSPSGHRLSASFFQVYRCRSTRTFDLEDLGSNPLVSPSGPNAAAFVPFGVLHCRATRTLGRITPSVVGVLSPSGLECCRTTRTLFLGIWCCRTGYRVLCPYVWDKDFFGACGILWISRASAIVWSIHECYRIVAFESVCK